MMPMLMDQKVTLTVVGPQIGQLQSGINASASYITISSVFYDAVFIGSMGNSSGTSGTGPLALDPNAMAFVMEAYSHGKAIGALGNSGGGFLLGLGPGSERHGGLVCWQRSDCHRRCIGCAQRAGEVPVEIPDGWCEYDVWVMFEKTPGSANWRLRRGNRHRMCDY